MNDPLPSPAQRPPREIAFTPVIACCDGCVLAGLRDAGFDLSNPFVIVSGIASRSTADRTSLLDTLVAGERSEVFILLATAASSAHDDDRELPNIPTDDAILDEKTMREILGLENEGDAR